MANALAIEEEENQRELSERIRKQELRQQDEFTNNQIRYVLPEVHGTPGQSKMAHPKAMDHNLKNTHLIHNFRFLNCNFQNI